jgi:hypothetical protein
MRELLDKLSNYQVLIVDVIYQVYHTRGVITCSQQLFFLVFHYLFTISESENCRFFIVIVFMCFFLYDEPFWENKNIFVLLMWVVCWSDIKEINLTTCSAGPHWIFSGIWGIFCIYILLSWLYCHFQVLGFFFLLFIWYYWCCLGSNHFSNSTPQTRPPGLFLCQ